MKVTYSLVRTVWDTAKSPDAENEIVVQELTMNLGSVAMLKKLAEVDKGGLLDKAQEKEIKDAVKGNSTVGHVQGAYRE